jgi:hypothetical protein
MKSFQDIIEEELQTVKERDEIIDANEFSLICEAKKFRPPGEKWYSKHRALVGPGAKVGATIASLLTLNMYGYYRGLTDKCVQRCQGLTGSRKTKCNSICNMNAAKHVLTKIKSKKGQLTSIKDPEQRRKAATHLNKEYEKWQDRYEKYKDRAQASTVMMSKMDD